MPQAARPLVPQLVLYHFPGACSQVCVFALEHARLPYALELVDLKNGEQAGERYAAVSPLGKVPALAVDGVVLTENAAIQTYVDALRPEAGLFQRPASPMDAARQQAGLSFCGGTLHPIVRGLANPQRITEGDPEGVRRKSLALAKKSFGHAEACIARSGWWMERWSVVDVYLNWALSVARSAGFDVTPYPTLDGLAARLGELPAFRRTLVIEDESRAELERRRAGPPTT